MSELIAVRPDERFDVNRLSGWLAGVEDLPEGTPQVSQFGRGKAHLRPSRPANLQAVVDKSTGT